MVLFLFFYLKLAICHHKMGLFFWKMDFLNWKMVVSLEKLLLFYEKMVFFNHIVFFFIEKIFFIENIIFSKFFQFFFNFFAKRQFFLLKMFSIFFRDLYGQLLNFILNCILCSAVFISETSFIVKQHSLSANLKLLNKSFHQVSQ